MDVSNTGNMHLVARINRINAKTARKCVSEFVWVYFLCRVTM